MYAVIETGGKQYRVEVGTELEVEYLDVQPGDAITLDRVLLVADGAQAAVGQPLVADAVVAAEVLRQDRGDKIISFKYRPKARRRVKKGHRQELTVLRVTDVRLGDRSAAADVRAAEDRARADRERIQEAAARQAAADAALAAQLAEARPADAPSSAAVRRRSSGAGAGEAGQADQPTVGSTSTASSETEIPTTGSSEPTVEATSEGSGSAEVSDVNASGADAPTADAEDASEVASGTETSTTDTATPRRARSTRSRATNDDTSGGAPTGEDA